VASVICFLFFLVELIFGLLSHSLSILSDAFHLLTDLASFLIAIWSSKLASGGLREGGGRYTYGYGRAEVLSALGSVMLLWGLTAVLVFEAVNRIVDIANVVPNVVEGGTMAIVAGVGVGVNLLLLAVLGVESHVHLPGSNDDCDFCDDCQGGGCRELSSPASGKEPIGQSSESIATLNLGWTRMSSCDCDDEGCGVVGGHMSGEENDLRTSFLDRDNNIEVGGIGLEGRKKKKKEVRFFLLANEKLRNEKLRTNFSGHQRGVN